MVLLNIFTLKPITCVCSFDIEKTDLYNIREVKKMLINNDKRIVDISAAVGYKNSDYFIRKFIEIKGMTPSQYRRQKNAE